MPHTASSEPLRIYAIFIGSEDNSFADLDRMFAAYAWSLVRAEVWKDVLLLPSAEDATHFLYRHVPNNASWIEALTMINLMPSSPAFILTSWVGDERLWADVLNRGGYDLLLEPFDAVEVQRVVAAALKHTRYRALSR